MGRSAMFGSFLDTKGAVFAAAFVALAMMAAPASAQIRPIDPDRAIDGDLAPAPAQPLDTPPPAYIPPETTVPPVESLPSDAASVPAAGPSQPSGSTFQKDDLIGAAEGVFGKGAKGLAELIEDLLKKQGEPNGYIVGREGGGAFIVGVRYGSGTLYHKVEGQQPVYWRGPSIGIDAGANAASTFVLVYNLYNTADLFHNFGAAEGQAYLIGGFHVSYLRRGDTVLVPVRAGAGLRLGLNAGYMRFSKKQNWVPF